MIDFQKQQLLYLVAGRTRVHVTHVYRRAKVIPNGVQAAFRTNPPRRRLFKCSFDESKNEAGRVHDIGTILRTNFREGRSHKENSDLFKPCH